MRPELLAPAGDLQTARIALRFGADAVYVGGPLLQLRAQSAGFARGDIETLVREARALKKRVYVAVNSFARDEEFDALRDYAQFLAVAGADAAIVSDPGVMALFHDAAPSLPLHVSTQANCTNAGAARVYYALGARRLVPARELSLSKLAELKKNLPVDMEIEAFVHGAMCMAYSGRCMMSAYLTGRGANRGACAQPCRWNYALEEEKRPGRFFPVEESAGRMAILSADDLCCLPFLGQLADAGIASFKIEGRMKSEFYVATVVNAYRRRLDDPAGDPAPLMRELDSVSHRPYSSGFYFGAPTGGAGEYEQGCLYAASVLSVNGGRARVSLKNKFSPGDVLEAVSPAVLGLRFEAKNIKDALGRPVEAAARPDEEYEIDCPAPLRAGDLLRRRLSAD
jgi:putative protease